MTKTLLLLAIAIVAGLAGSLTQALSADGAIESLSGQRGIEDNATAAQDRHWQIDQGVIPRQFVQQPPLIPHSIEGYKINLKFNKCLTCHSWANYRESDATKISQTHFADRDGNSLANVAARRYFCTQCHVPQTDAKPLVGNTFEPLPALRAR